MEKMPVPASPGSKEDPHQGSDHGQKPPSDSNPVKQRHQIAEPEQQSSIPGKAPY